MAAAPEAGSDRALCACAAVFPPFPPPGSRDAGGGGGHMTPAGGGASMAARAPLLGPEPEEPPGGARDEPGGLEEPSEGPQEPPEPPRNRCRSAAAFWLLGLCNNLPYVLALSGARDILSPSPTRALAEGPDRDCNPVSTGAVLLADILPPLALKLLAPLGAERVPYSWRVTAAAACAWGGAALLVSGWGRGAGLGGVVLASAASGLGEVTLLALAARYPSVGLHYWSSGTGGAGLGGALAYGALRQAGLPLPHALLPALALPPLTLGSYFFLLAPPPPPVRPLPPPRPPLTLAEKWGVAKPALVAVAPLAVVYFAEYFVNQGLLELLYFPASSLTHGDQYRWLQLLYQAGVFVSRSTGRCLRLTHVWGLAALQVVLGGLLLAAVLVPFLPGLGAAFVLLLGEGLVGGAAYANALLNVQEQAPPWGRELALGVASVADSVGIALAGAAALGAHRLLC